MVISTASSVPPVAVNTKPVLCVGSAANTALSVPAPPWISSLPPPPTIVSLPDPP